MLGRLGLLALQSCQDSRTAIVILSICQFGGIEARFSYSRIPDLPRRYLKYLLKPKSQRILMAINDDSLPCTLRRMLPLIAAESVGTENKAWNICKQICSERSAIYRTFFLVLWGKTFLARRRQATQCKLVH